MTGSPLLHPHQHSSGSSRILTAPGAEHFSLLLLQVLSSPGARAGSCGPRDHGTPGCAPGEEPTGVGHGASTLGGRCWIHPSLTSLSLHAGMWLSGDVPSLSPRHLLTGGHILLCSHPLPGWEQDPGGSGDRRDRQPLRILPAGVSPAWGCCSPTAPVPLVGHILTLPSHPAGFTALKARRSPWAGACPAPVLPAAPRAAEVGADRAGMLGCLHS